MRINVAELLKSPMGTVRNDTASETVDIAGGSGLVQGDVRLLRTDCSVLVRGELSVEVELTCSRCLNQFRCPFNIIIEEEYFPTADVVTGIPLSPPDDPGSFTIDQQNILDLSEAVRQYALLSVPMKPLCRDDCAGLCPTCGCNLNQVSCSCTTKQVDPRWAELSKLVVADNQVSGNEEKGIK